MFLPSNITLQFGDSGDFVTELQRRLAMVNAFAEDMVNGFFDGNTVNGVTHFQAMVGLHADGVAGPETLRRLNGMVSSGGTKSDKKEEEKGPSEAQKSVFFGLTGEAEQNPAAWQQPEKPEQAQPTVAAPAPQAAAEPPRREEAMPQAPKLQADPTIAAMFFEQAASAQRNEAAAIREAATNPMVDATMAAEKTKTTNLEAVQEAKAEPKGIIAKVTQFASEYLQRLANYFEARLPPSVLSEVQAIGQAMAKTGMRETPVPTGPEMLQTPVTPARGAGQAQQI